MANALTQLPLIIDTDITSFRASAPSLQGIRVLKVVLAVGPGGVSVAGTVVITAPSDNAVLYPTLAVPAGQAINTILYTDNPEYGARQTWRDFAVTGVTATGTKLYIWFQV